MSQKPRILSYRLHRQSSQAIVTLTDSLTGRRKDHLLGKYNTAASKEEYKRVVLDWKARARRLLEVAQADDLSLAELINRYWRQVEEYYRHPDGTPNRGGAGHALRAASAQSPLWHGTGAGVRSIGAEGRP